MAQISIIKKSDIAEAHRFDAEYFKPEFIDFENKINKMGYVFLKDISINYDHKRVPIKEELRTKGQYPYYGAQGIIDYVNNYIFDGNYLLVAEDGENLRSRNKDIAFSANGRFWVNNHAHVLGFTDFKTQEVVRTYLNIVPLRVVSGVAQPKLSKANLENIKIPRKILDINFQLQIEKIIKFAYQKQIQSKQLYKEAEQLLLGELGLVNYKPKHQLTFTTTKKEIDEAKRFDAEYFQPKYKEIIEKIENYEGGFDVLENLTTYINNGNQPPYTEDGEIKFFSQKWIKDQGIDYDFLESDEEPMVSKTFFEDEKNKSSLVKKGDILYYSVGANLGFCHTYLEDVPIAVGSFINIIRADKTRVNEVFLGFILNSIVGRLQGDKEKSGIAQPYIYAKNLRKFKIPLIKPEIQKQIAEKIQQSHKLRKESKELLEEAKRKVEEEIEKRV